MRAVPSRDPVRDYAARHRELTRRIERRAATRIERRQGMHGRAVRPAAQPRPAHPVPLRDMMRRHVAAHVKEAASDEERRPTAVVEHRQLMDRGASSVPYRRPARSIPPREVVHDHAACDQERPSYEKCRSTTVVEDFEGINHAARPALHRSPSGTVPRRKAAHQKVARDLEAASYVESGSAAVVENSQVPDHAVDTGLFAESRQPCRLARDLRGEPEGTYLDPGVTAHCAQLDTLARTKVETASTECTDLHGPRVDRHPGLQPEESVPIRNGFATRAGHDHGARRGGSIGLEDDTFEHDREAGAAVVDLGRPRVEMDDEVLSRHRAHRHHRQDAQHRNQALPAAGGVHVRLLENERKLAVRWTDPALGPQQQGAFLSPRWCRKPDSCSDLGRRHGTKGDFAPDQLTEEPPTGPSLSGSPSSTGPPPRGRGAARGPGRRGSRRRRSRARRPPSGS